MMILFFIILQISGKTELNEADKNHNKELAEALVLRGIHEILEPGLQEYK